MNTYVTRLLSFLLYKVFITMRILLKCSFRLILYLIVKRNENSEID